MNGYKEMVLSHSAKGHKWKNHKYTSVVIGKNGKKRYIYNTLHPSVIDPYMEISSENDAIDNTRKSKDYNGFIDNANKQFHREHSRFANRGYKDESRMGDRKDIRELNRYNMSRDTSIGKQSSARRKENIQRKNESTRAKNRLNMRAQTDIGKQSSKLAANQRKVSYKAKIKYYAAVNKAKKYAKKGKEAVKKFIDKNIKKTFTVNKNQIILPDSGARVTFK